MTFNYLCSYAVLRFGVLISKANIRGNIHYLLCTRSSVSDSGDMDLENLNHSSEIWKIGSDLIIKINSIKNQELMGM